MSVFHSDTPVVRLGPAAIDDPFQINVNVAIGCGVAIIVVVLGTGILIVCATMARRAQKSKYKSSTVQQNYMNGVIFSNPLYIG